jgi:LysR family hydrogen peroxide-inducible transcriptional activator
LQETTNKLSLYVEEGPVADLAGKLRTGDLDAILVTAPFAEADVAVQPLFDEPFVVLMPADHRLANKVRIAPSDFAPGELLLLGEGDSLREQILAAFPQLDPKAESGAGIRTFTQGATLETLRHMVASAPRRDHPAADRGRSAALCPQSADHPAVRGPGPETQPGAGLAREFSAT